MHRPAPGPVGALLAAAVVLLPSLLPRDPVVQAVLVLVAALHGHVAGVLVGRVAGRWGRSGSRLAVPFLPGALTLLVASTAVSFHRQVADARTVHAPAPDLLQHSASVAAGLLLAAVVVHVLRRVRRRTAVLAALIAVVLGAGAAVHLAAVPSGLKGAQFLAATPTAARIEAATGRPAVQPVRVYAGLDAAPTARGRAQRAVADLVREGGFDRSLLLVAVPTGTGWVNPAAPAAVEFLRDGDTAVVAQQYAASSSFVAYVGGTAAVQESTRALVDAVTGEVRRRRAEGRRVPAVVVTGESLGLWAACGRWPDAPTAREVSGSASRHLRATSSEPATTSSCTPTTPSGPGPRTCCGAPHPRGTCRGSPCCRSGRPRGTSSAPPGCRRGTGTATTRSTSTRSPPSRAPRRRRAATRPRVDPEVPHG